MMFWRPQIRRRFVILPRRSHLRGMAAAETSVKSKVNPHATGGAHSNSHRYFSSDSGPAVRSTSSCFVVSGVLVCASTNSVTTTTPGTGSSTTSTIVVSVCRGLGGVVLLDRLEAGFFATDRFGLALAFGLTLAFCRFGFALTRRLAACFFAVFDFFGALLPAFTLRAVARLVRLVITPSL
jgi:hypothetical protein